MTLGILALQGDFARHAEHLSRLGVQYIFIRQPHELKHIQGLIIPGGESTALLKLMEPLAWSFFIKQFYQRGHWIFGTCAGAILLATDVSPIQPSLGLMDISIERNAYGRQLQSFVSECQPENKRLGLEPMECVFIRAPKIIRLGSEVNVLLKHKQDPILVQQDRLFAATFHPELTEISQTYCTLLQQF